MEIKQSIEQANPFLGIEHATAKISDITPFNSKIEFKLENGVIVTLPNEEICLLSETNTEDLQGLEIGSSINIICDLEGNAYKNDEKFKLYKAIIAKANEGHIFTANIVNATKQGLIVVIDELQCFLPEGQIGVEKRGNLETFVGNNIDVKLISVKLKEKEGNRFLPIVSHKILEDEKYAIEIQDKLQDIQVGSVIQGTVKNIASYGVFVTLFPTVEGLVHITDLSWERVSDPSEIVSIGQNINVLILDIKQTNDGKKRISLGVKQLSQKPWELFDKNSKEGDIVSGSICNIVDYGLFIMLPSGVQGLVHRTELSWNSKITSKHFEKGQVVSAKIINIDWEKEKLLLSIKQMQEDPWENIEDKISVGDIVDTIIDDITSFGLFVSIYDGIGGLIHKSDFSWTEIIKKPRDYYTIGEHIKAKIISIDKDKKKIELSHRQILPNPWQKHIVGQHINAIIREIDKSGINVMLEEDNLPAFIPARLISKDSAFEINNKLECLIQEIDENKRRIILAIV